MRMRYATFQQHLPSLRYSLTINTPPLFFPNTPIFGNARTYNESISEKCVEADWQRSVDDEQMELYCYLYIRSLEQAFYQDQFSLPTKLSGPLNPGNFQFSLPDQQSFLPNKAHSPIKKSDQPRTYNTQRITIVLLSELDPLESISKVIETPLDRETSPRSTYM